MNSHRRSPALLIPFETNNQNHYYLQQIIPPPSATTTADQLPIDILHTIQALLPFKDYARFRAVCTSWRHASKSNTHPPQDHNMPWLFNLYSRELKSKSRKSFVAYRFPPNNDRPPEIYFFPIPQEILSPVEDLRFISSIGPRLLIGDYEKESLLLLNPFSWTKSPVHNLPVKVLSPMHPHLSYRYFFKVVAPHDYDGRNGIAVAFLYAYHWLLYSRSGGPWVHLDPTDDAFSTQGFHDVHHYQDNLFIAVRTTDQKVIAMDFSSPSSSRPAVIDLTFNLHHDFPPTATYGSHQLKARIIIISHKKRGRPAYLYLIIWKLITYSWLLQTKKVYVYRLPLPDKVELEDIHSGNMTKTRHWVQVNKLDDGCSFFMGPNKGISLSARDYPGLKANRIYFPFQEFNDTLHIDFEADLDGNESYNSDLDHYLIYNMEDGSWKQHFGFEDYNDEFYTAEDYKRRCLMPSFV